MRYLLDTNFLNTRTLPRLITRDNLYVLQDVIDEYTTSKTEISNVNKSGIKTIYLASKHLRKMYLILESWGTNYKLIDLYSFEGKADIAMLAFVISERDEPDTLFSEKEYVIVTNDDELRRVAESYGIKCLKDLS